MRALMRVLATAAIAVACAGTKTSPPPQSTEPQWILELATEKVGENPVVEPNKDNTFYLCWTDKLTSSNVPALQFIIVRIGDRRIVEQGSVTMAEVHWTDLYEVQVSPKQGQVELQRSGGATTRTINVRKYR